MPVILLTALINSSDFDYYIKLSFNLLLSYLKKMEIKSAVFITSNTHYENCPEPNKPEYAFIGRSNVGKSSLINMLTSQNKLAKVSGKPGKTQLINHFLIDEQWYLVDLPGYGWAKVSKEKRGEWGPMTKNYLINRKNLQCVFVLVDSRLEPQAIDIEFIHWVGTNNIPFAIVFTKSDKQSPNKTQKNIAGFKRRMLQDWEEMPQYFITSAVSSLGKDNLIQFIRHINQQISE